MVTLLKAFSQFKKRQRCSMQLLLALSGPEGNEALHQKLASYKYREEVQVMQQLPMAEIARLSAGAYGIIASANYQPGWWLLGSMQAGTALVTEETPTSAEVCGAGSYHLPKWETDTIAQAMMLLYKDETYRSKLIANSQQKIGSQGMNSVVALLWQCIENITTSK
jgi:predicted RecA/RadA family phage recombinase